MLYIYSLLLLLLLLLLAGGRSRSLLEGRPTLCLDGVRDGAGVAEAVGVGGAHQEQVDGAGLQAPQHEGVRLHVLRQRLPAAARRVAAGGGGGGGGGGTP